MTKESEVFYIRVGLHDLKDIIFNHNNAIALSVGSFWRPLETLFTCNSFYVRKHVS